MAVLSAQTIRKLGIVSPFREKYQWEQSLYSSLSHTAKLPTFSGGLSSCGYDVAHGDHLYLEPGEFALSVTMEKFHMPTNVVGKTANKSTWARKGLMVPYTILEPGWTGFLTLELKNIGSETLRLPRGVPLLQVIFEYLDEPTESPYGNGKYQDQPNVPIHAK